MILAEKIKAAFDTFQMQLDGFAKDAYRKDIRIAKLTDALAYAIKEADGWHDECRGTPVQSAVMEHARSLLVDTKMPPHDCDEKSARIAELEAERVQWRERVVSLEGTLFGTLELLENTDGLSKNNIDNLAGEKAAEIRKALLLPVAKSAEASAQAVEQQPIGYISNILLTERRKTFERDGAVMYSQPAGMYTTPVFAAPQAADTDKVREAIANISNNQITEAWESCGGVGGFYKSFGYQQFAHAVLDLAADALLAMAAQAPVREVPGYKLVPIEPTPEMLTAAWNGGALGGEDDHVECWSLMLAAAPLPAAPVRQEGFTPTNKEQA